jgi:uncharacterized membrane protein YhhN
MNKKAWLYLFVIVLIMDLAGVLLPNELLQSVSKPLIIISLFVYFIVATKNTSSRFKVWVFLALFFSWIGDVLLMFDRDGSLYFILGLSAFLLAHVFYIIFFNKVRTTQMIGARWWYFLIVVLYYGVFIAFIHSYLGDMSIPVKVYAVVISSMFLLSLHMLHIKNRKAGTLMMVGALLFVISDSVLAINRFYSAFEGAGFIIMLAYGLAQLSITEGAVRYLTSASKQ